MIDFCNQQWTTAMEGGRIIHTGQPWMWYDSDAVCDNNGTIELLAYREPNTIHHWDGKTYRPTVACGLLRSVDTFGYGTFSAEIMLPKGKNLWPAFWLVGGGERDWPADGRHDYTGSRRLPLLFSLKRPAHNFIKYEVEWRQDIITFRVNGKRVRTYGYDVAKQLHDKRMNVIFYLWTTDEDFTCKTPMKIRNFEYKPLETL